jgi:hypothetical protein
MAKFIGRRSDFAIGKEAVRGTPALPTTLFWTPFASNDLRPTVVKSRFNEAMGQIADGAEAAVVNKQSEGTIEAVLRDKALGMVLTNVMGASPSSSAGPPYTHTYTLADENNAHQSLAMLLQDPTQNLLFALAMINEFEISVVPNEPVNYRMAVLSKVGKDWAAQTPDYTSKGSYYIPNHLQFRVASAIGDLGAASELDLTELTFNINKNLSLMPNASSLEPQDINNRQLSVTGSIGLALENTTWRDYMLANTNLAVEIYFYIDANHSLKFQLPNVDFDEWEPVRELDEVVVQNLTFTAKYDETNAQKIIHLCELVNLLDGTGY